MNDADLSQQPPTDSEPEIPTAEPHSAGDIEPPATPEDGTGYLWRPIETPAQSWSLRPLPQPN